MKAKNVVKFNMYLSLVLLGITVLMLVGVTVAYFSDTKQTSNTFTVGNVEIALSEAAVRWDLSGDLVEDPSASRVFGTSDDIVTHRGKFYPGQSVFKDPTITNTGDEPAWIAAKVILTDGSGDLTQVMGYEGYEDIDIEVLLAGGLLDEKVHVGTWNDIPFVCYNDRYAMIQVADATEGRFEFFFLMLQPVAAGDSVVLFDHVMFPLEFNNSEMQQLADLKIQVQAFGVQTYQLESCLDAMTKAFTTEFNFH